MQIASMTDWTITNFMGRRLKGIVSGHPKHRDGSPLYSSIIRKIDFEKGVAWTLNTKYILVGKESTHGGKACGR